MNMSEPATTTSGALQAGLLMESAQALQRSAEQQLAELRVHVEGLDQVVREAIRLTLIDELKALAEEAAKVTAGLVALRRTTHWRSALYGALASFAVALLPTVLAYSALPSPSEIDKFRSQRDQLLTQIARLKAQGGGLEWRRCGESQRLCVRVDRKAPAYGEAADYFVAAGY